MYAMEWNEVLAENLFLEIESHDVFFFKIIHS